MIKAGEIRSMSEEDILKSVEDKKKELLELRCSVALGDDVNPMQVKTLRREIAKLLTILNEKKIAGGVK